MHVLSATKAGAGVGTITSSPKGINCGATCSASYAAASVVTLTATPAGGSVFSGWSGGCSGTGACQVTMTAARAVTASFVVNPVNAALTVVKAGPGTGTVRSTPAGITCGATCAYDYAAGLLVTLTATPDAGSTFSAWSGGCSGSGTCQVVAGAAPAVTATFALGRAGLVAGWGFNDAAGTTARDSSTSGNTGALVNGPTWTAGKHGGALLFDGINDRVRVNDSASLDLTTQATFEAWVFPTVALSGWRTILQKEVDAYFLTASGGGDSATSGGTLNGAVTFVADTATLPANVWSHVAATYDGVRIRLFRNGILVSSRAVTGSYEVNGGPLWIGGNAVYGEHFKGKLDEIRIYNRVLTAVEISGDMNTPLP